MPYFLPLTTWESKEVALIVLRILVILWLLAATIITVVSIIHSISTIHFINFAFLFPQFKSRSFVDIFTWTTFFDIFLSMIILGCQMASIGYILMMHNTFPAKPDNFFDEEIRSQFFELRGYGYRFQLIMLLDTMTFFCCISNIMTILRKIQAVDHLVASFINCLVFIVRGFLFYGIFNIGLCFFNMAIYGGKYQRYSDFLNGLIATIYG